MRSLLTVTRWRACTMCFKVLWAVRFASRIEPTPGVRLSNESLLGLGARHRNARCLSIRIYTCLANNAFNVVPVSDGLAESL